MHDHIHYFNHLHSCMHMTFLQSHLIVMCVPCIHVNIPPTYTLIIMHVIIYIHTIIMHSLSSPPRYSRTPIGGGG